MGQRTALLAGIVGLLIAMLRISRDRLDYERFAEGQSKAVLLRAIDRVVCRNSADRSAR